MDMLIVLGSVLLVVSLGMLIVLGLWKLCTEVAAPDSNLHDWLLGETCPPERGVQAIDPIVFQTLQGMNQLSQRRYSGLRRAERVSDEFLWKVQEITGEQP